MTVRRDLEDYETGLFLITGSSFDYVNYVVRCSETTDD